MLDPVAFVIGVACVALATGLWAAAEEEGVDIHVLARRLADKASGTARRLGISTDLAAAAIAARVVAMCRFEIGELSRAASRNPAAVSAQEVRLRKACSEVAAKVAEDARLG